jgi:DNA repair exonuclease SbcCD ATPase subunit
MDRSERKPEERAIDLEIEAVENSLRRWEETLEHGLLSLEECADRIRELRHRREGIQKWQEELRRSRRTNKLSTIPTTLMGAFIQQMQAKLLEKKIGQKQEFKKNCSRGKDQGPRGDPDL